MKNEEKAPRKRMFSEEQKADLFKEREPAGGVLLGGTPLSGIPLLKQSNVQKNEDEILIRVQFKSNLETQYLLNCLCKKKKVSRDAFIAYMVRKEAKKENIGISIH